MSDPYKLHTYKDRQEYIDSQISRSQEKVGYCKVYFEDVFRYRDLVEWGGSPRDRQAKARRPSRILCLGVRNGAEVDIFRSVFFGPLMSLALVRDLIVSRDTTSLGQAKTRLAKLGGIGSGGATDGRVLGVEINPNIGREDIWIGSFDEMPREWSSQFDLIYSNSFDHLQDPEKTIEEWKRVATPGAQIIVCFSPKTHVSDHDPFGGLDFEMVKDLWGLDVVFYSETANRNGYYEVCFRAR